MSRTRKILLYTSLVAFTTFIVAFGAAAFWLMADSRSLPYISKKIEQNLNALETGYKFKLKDLVFEPVSFERSLKFRATDILVSDRIGNEVLKVPDVELDVDISSLLLGNIVFDEAVIRSPRFNIDISGQERVVIFKGGDDKKVSSIYFASILNIIGNLKSIKSELPIRDIGIVDAKVIINNGAEEIPWQIPEAFFALKSYGDSASFDASMELLDAYTGERSFLSVEAGVLSDNIGVFINTKANNIPSIYASDLFPDSNWLSSLNLAFSGDLKVTINSNNDVESLDFSILANEEQKIVFDLGGKVKVNSEYKGHKNVPYGKIDLAAKEIALSDFDRYWPPNMGVNARKWVTENIVDGVARDVEVSISFSEEEYIYGEIKKDSIDGRMIFSGLSIKYIDGFEPVNNIEGSCIFNANSFVFDISSGNLGSSNLQAIVDIYDIKTSDPMLEMEAVTNGPIKDVTPFLFLLQKAKSKDSGIIDFNKLTGKTNIVHSYKIPLESNLRIDEVEFIAGAEMKDVAYPAITNGKNLHDGNFNISVTNDNVVLKGSGFIDKSKINIDFKEDFTGQTDPPREYQINSYLTSKELENLAGTKLPNFDGAVGIEVNVGQKDSSKNISADINIKDADIKIPSIGWHKKLEESATLKINANDNGKEVVKISDFKLEANEMLAEGSAEINKDKSLFNIKKIEFGKTNMNLRIVSASDGEYVINIKGKSFDASPVLDLFAEGVEESEGSNVDIELLLEKMYLKNDITINNVEGHVLCSKKFCKTVGIKGSLDQGENVEISLRPDSQDVSLTIVSDNGGKVLRGLDIIKDVQGGTFATSAVAPVAENERVYEGKMIMKDFKVVDAPVLAKLLTVASFAGIVDLLSGEGISFDKMKGKYTFKEDVLKLKNVKASGDSLAITIDGDIDFNAAELRLQGNIVPATMLNNLLENIPFLGFALTGGGDESLIATRYTIVGTFADPDITVNPFSILTPGFLRNIWGDVTDDELEEEDNTKEEEVTPAPVRVH